MTSANAKKILWVEDERDIVAAVKPLLQREGWEVSTAASAEEGRTMASEIEPDLIIMDVIMTGEHGISAVENLKNDPKLRDVPVILFTNLTRRWSETTATREDLLLTEAEDYVDKSQGPIALIEAIRERFRA